MTQDMVPPLPPRPPTRVAAPAPDPSDYEPLRNALLNLLEKRVRAELYEWRTWLEAYRLPWLAAFRPFHSPDHPDHPAYAAQQSQKEANRRRLGF